ncbi:MAG: AraC family transcriptional regulator [Lachnospiraceae bacterium]|nr:AraC family transcriptional regulator [uncultured Acetatifactor sp.]MCI9221267.1 AraC family transcriptional regulator [Lachnospiraceae bacterium]
MGKQEDCQAEMLRYYIKEWAGENSVWASRDFLRKGKKSPASLWAREGEQKPSEIMVDSYEPERLHIHADFLELFYVHGGRGVAFLEGTNYILQKGDIFCVRPGQVHANFPLEDLMIYNCIISCNYLREKSGLPTEELMPFLHLTGRTLLTVERIYDDLLQEQEQREKFYPYMLENSADRLCASLLRFQAGHQVQIGHRRAITPLLEYLSQHFAAVTLEELARVSSYNASYLSRLFRETFDIPFTDYVNILRVNQAMKLLRETDLTAEEIGLEVGFHSRKHFYDMFKRHTGMTPGAFREET